MHNHFVTSNSFVPQTSKWREALSDDRMAVPVPFFPSQSNHPFLKYLYLEIWPWKSQAKVMGSKVISQMIADEQGKSTGAESSDRPSNLTQTGFKLSIFGQCDLEIDGWPRKTTGHLFYTISNIVHHFKAIGEFKLELQSGKAQFGSCVTLKFDGWPWKTIGHLFYTMSSFVHNFKAICWFKLELQSGNAHFGSKSAIFLSHVTLKFDRWP